MVLCKLFDSFFSAYFRWISKFSETRLASWQKCLDLKMLCTARIVQDRRFFLCTVDRSMWIDLVAWAVKFAALKRMEEIIIQYPISSKSLRLWEISLNLLLKLQINNQSWMQLNRLANVWTTMCLCMCERERLNLLEFVQYLLF